MLREKRDVTLDHELYTAARSATGVGPAPAVSDRFGRSKKQGQLNKAGTNSSPQPVMFANTTNASEHDHAPDHRKVRRARVP